MIDRPEPPLSAEALEERLRSLARTFFGAAGVDDLELRHLLEILSRSSLLLDDVFDPGTLDRILSKDSRPNMLLQDLPPRGSDGAENRRFRVWSVPDLLKTYGDRCLYDVGLAGRRRYRGIDLNALGPRSYGLASEVLALLADDRLLRQFYDRNLMERLPIEEEILFLRQCASRFQIHARLLQALRGQDPAAPVGGHEVESVAAAAAEASSPGVHPAREPVVIGGGIGTITLPLPGPVPGPAVADEGLAGGVTSQGLEREERLAGYERALLFSTLDVGGLRARLKETVVDQVEAVDRLCDDLAVHALGTQARPGPQSYLLVGPTGVGKNYLIESLVGLLESIWSLEVPLLILEGPQYTYPSDVGELKGSTRGFIRSDEEGLLAEFHTRARKAPLSFVIVDEIEKAHPQLARFFLALMDRGFTMDNRGRTLRFPATVLAFTSNLGYSDDSMRTPPIGYGEAGRRKGGRRGAAARDLKRVLPPEFLNRLRVIHFAPLARASAERILDQEMARVVARFRRLHDVEVTVSPAARRAILELGFSEEYGARHLVRQVDRVLNVDVGIRLNASARPLSKEGLRILERIRAARDGGRAIDEETLRLEVAGQIRLAGKGVRVLVDWNPEGVLYRLEGV